MVNTVSSPGTTGAATAAAGTTASGTTQAQDRFLKLLVAQLNNQDPMNPMDNAQMTSQMAQINTVTGIQQLNETMQAMSAQFNALQLMQGTSMVGREVLSKGDKMSRDGNTARASFDLSGTASAVKAEILSPGGQVVGTVDLGPLAAGRHEVEWDASGYKGGGDLGFRIVATNTGRAVDSTLLSRDRVTSVGIDKGAVSLQLSRGSSIPATSVVSVL